jgi:hypothetical protein
MPSRRPLRERIAERRWQECEVSGCGRLVHSLSRWCSRHAAHANRHGSPIAPAISRAAVKPYEAVARHLLYFPNRNHPAIKLVIGELDALLAKASLYAKDEPKPKGRDAAGRLRHELARLHKAGVTGRRILVICAGLHSYARENVGSVGAQWIGSRRHRFCLARHVLQQRGHGGHSRCRAAHGKRVDLSTRVLDKAGERLIEITDRLLTALEPALARQLSHSRAAAKAPTCGSFDETPTHQHER